MLKNSHKYQFIILELLILFTIIYSTSLHLIYDKSETRITTRYYWQKLPANYMPKKFFDDIGKFHQYKEQLKVSSKEWTLFSGDSRFYLAQTIEQSSGKPPYKYRILPTSIAKLIKHILNTSYYKAYLILNIILLTAIVLIFRDYLLKLGFNHVTTLFGNILFVTMVTTTNTLILPMLEIFSFFWMILIMISIQRENVLLFIFSSVLGVMTKEILLVASFLWIFHNLSLRNLFSSMNFKTLIIASIPGITFVLLRYFLGGGLAEVNYGYNLLEGEFPKGYLNHFLSWNGFIDTLIAFFCAFSFVWAGLLNINKSRFLAKSSLAIPVIMTVIILLSGQKTRTLGIIYPIIIPLFLFYIDSYIRNVANSNSKEKLITGVNSHE